MDAWRESTLFLLRFGAGLGLLLMIVEWVRGLSSRLNVYVFLMGLVLFSILARMSLYQIEPLPDTRMFLGFFVSLLAVGPLALRLGHQITNGILPIPLRGPDKWVLHIAFVLECLFQFGLPEAERSDMLYRAFWQVDWNIISSAIVICALVLIFYFAMIIVMVRRTIREYELKYVNFVWFLVMGPFLGAVTGIAGFAFKWDAPFNIGSHFLTVTTMLFFIIPAKYSEFFISIVDTMEQKRYEKSILHNLDLELIKNRLEELMEKKHLYLDETLRLGQLAEELLITPHQLSRLLNEHYNKNFNDFVNDYRVAAAKELLAGEPEMTILNIAYRVGFNTKATFNAQFSKLTGQTPSQYRKQALKK